MDSTWIALLLIAIPGLLLVAVPMICGMWVLVTVAGITIDIIRHIGTTIKSFFKPQLVHLTDGAIKTKFRDLDNKENGYNPIRQDYHVGELFPRKPDLEKIKAAGKKLFPNHYQCLLTTNKKPNNQWADHHMAHQFILNMLVQRQHQIQTNRWSQEQEKLWLEMPYLPEPMHQVDDEYVNLILVTLGQQGPEKLAS